jgi:hypothetical protein
VGTVEQSAAGKQVTLCSLQQAHVHMTEGVNSADSLHSWRGVRGTKRRAHWCSAGLRSTGSAQQPVTYRDAHDTPEQEMICCTASSCGAWAKCNMQWSQDNLSSKCASPPAGTASNRSNQSTQHATQQFEEFAAASDVTCSLQCSYSVTKLSQAPHQLTIQHASQQVDTKLAAAIGVATSRSCRNCNRMT